ncbi:hypothetical protein SNEBB_000523 [Seison nebaliae]|nr:hypothetical protein SNEBB_000523 [Seison nebaliae]
MEKKKELAKHYAEEAVTFDGKHEYENAIQFYAAAIDLLLSLQSELAMDKTMTVPPNFSQQIHSYLKRAEELKRLVKSRQEKNKGPIRRKSDYVELKERCKFLIKEAIDSDENGTNDEEALALYTEGIENLLTLKKQLEDESEIQNVLTIITNSMSRAEELKTRMKSHNFPKKLNRQPTQTYSSTELQVLKIGSNVNGKLYVPWFDCDENDRFAFSKPFSDPDGLIPLAAKQKKVLAGWARPSEFMDDPKMIVLISSRSIQQTIISDCSFVASLAVAAQFETKYKQRLITDIIYPQNRMKQPLYNPCGKYLIKLHLNGIPRKIVIDDRLPVDKYGELLVSKSSNHNELWISLLEKAYMKVHGGYDFPGSNSTVDLYALTGWIPERIHLSFQVDDEVPLTEENFDRLMQRFHSGDCLATVATKNINEVESKRSGLVPTHAYALLDLRKLNDFETTGMNEPLRLLQLKNPWAHEEWKGNFSEYDTTRWTSKLKRALDFDPKANINVDDGIFWIDLKSLRQFFSTLYVNWKPDMFEFRTSYNRCWNEADGPSKDAYFMGNNPQYSIEVNLGDKGQTAAIWFHLIRHITEKDDFADNREFIALHIFNNSGNRVYYPRDPEPLLFGRAVNSPLYLSKIIMIKSNDQTTKEYKSKEMPHTVVSESPESIRRYTIIVTQYEKSRAIYYTLRAYSTCQFKMKELIEPYRYKESIASEWNHSNSGGCANNHLTYHKNPKFLLSFGSMSDMKIELKAGKDFAIGMEMMCVEGEAMGKESLYSRIESGKFRYGYAMLLVSNIPAGTYEIVVATFSPNQLSPFILTVASTNHVKLNNIF